MSGIPSWAVKGARVVCVEDLWAGRCTGWITPPCVGTIYTIEGVTAQSCNEWRGPFVTLVEIDSEPYGFELSAFRPLITLEDDLEAHFRILLRQPVSDKEPAL
jgi:hypothetical protein